MTEFFANGKLLLTGEYAVLDGALAIGLPTQPGQSLKIGDPVNEGFITWKALLPENRLWFRAEIDAENFSVLNCSDSKAAERLAELLKTVSKLNSKAIRPQGFAAETLLDFPKDWGLGSSSTLIALLSKCFDVNAYTLLEQTFGGSGYDVSCALMPKPQTYQLGKNDRKIRFIHLNSNITDHLYFIYLNQKQNSREGIQRYRSQPKSERLIKGISDISKQITVCDNLYDFEDLIHVHEQLISNHLGLETVQNELFSDYSGGEIKSLGAWGGDFILATSEDGDLSYFEEKGFPVIFNYKNLIV